MPRRYEIEITLNAGPKPYFVMIPPVITVQKGIDTKPMK